ncbi:MAG: AAA family ATPase, partial [Rhodospirillales bacterium]|nr:AAA family ATPase [Rhodospirillales bacterium]
AAALAAGLDQRETAATIRSGIEAGLATPREMPERERPGAGAAQADQVAQVAPPVDGPGLLGALDAATWAALDLPPERRILGDLLTATSRAFIVGGTGLGKTQLAHAMAAGIASGDGFLHWRSDGPARVLVIDGEMSKALIRDRMAAVIRRNASPIPAGNLVVYALDRSEEFAERFPGLGQFEPLNTPAGHAFVKRLVALLLPDAVIFDNVMSLIAGDQKDEVPWSETVPLVAWITSRGLGQVWLDHTGHDRSRQYGSATKAWRFDAVGIMSGLPAVDQKPGEVAFNLSFDSPGKARRRTPANWGEFAPSVIRLAGDKWTVEAGGPGGRAGGIGPAKVQPSIVAWHDALLDALCVSASPGSATKDEWFAEGVRRSLTDAPEEGDTRTIREAKRAKFRKAVAALVTARWVSADGETVRDLIGGKRP